MTLQLVSRYRTWLDGKLSDGNNGANANASGLAGTMTQVEKEREKERPIQNSASGLNLRGVSWFLNPS